MVRIEDTVWCDSCGVEITWVPLVVDERDYCCENCYKGFACECNQRMEDEDRRGRKSPGTAGIDNW